MLGDSFYTKYYYIGDKFPNGNKISKKIIFTKNKNKIFKQNFTAKQIMDLQEIDNLNIFDINYYGKKINKSNVEITKDFITTIIDNYLISISKCFNTQIKTGIISDVTCFMPFIRFSSIDDNYVITFFSVITLFNGENIFSVSELMSNEVNTDYEKTMDYIKEAGTSVRGSSFMHTGIYSYMNENNCNDTIKGKLIIFRYILNLFIKENFDVDLSNIEYKTIIIGVGSFLLPQNISKELSIILSKKELLAGIEKKNFKTYDEYVKFVFDNMFEFICFHMSYSSFFNMLKKKKLYNNDVIRLSILIDELKRGKRKYKITLIKEEEKSMEEYLKNSNKYEQYAATLGAFLGSFIKENQ